MINQFSNSSEKYNFQCNSTSLTNNSSANTATALEKNFDLINNHGAFCACVECKPIGNDHENFLSDIKNKPKKVSISSIDVLTDINLIRNIAKFI